jgi:hypothetical protein
MKTSLALLSSLCLLALAVPACAHPNHESPAQGYLVFWKGVQPKPGAFHGYGVSPSDFWRMAFVSKYRILGAQVPALLP